MIDMHPVLARRYLLSTTGCSDCSCTELRQKDEKCVHFINLTKGGICPNLKSFHRALAAFEEQYTAFRFFSMLLDAEDEVTPLPLFA